MRTAVPARPGGGTCPCAPASGASGRSRSAGSVATAWSFCPDLLGQAESDVLGSDGALGAPGRGRGHHHRTVRPRPGRGHRARHHYREHPVQPAQGGSGTMTMPLRQSLRIGTYLMRQKLARKDKFPLLVELEPLFACNLKCAGCGKIQQPHTLLKQRMPVAQAIGAIEECGAPMVSIAGGEPLMHPQIHELVAELIKRKKYVFLCTNALLIPKHIDKFKPSRYFAWAVHI